MKTLLTFFLSCCLGLGLIHGQDNPESLQSRWMHKGAALKLHGLAIPALGGEGYALAGGSFQIALHRILSEEVTVTAGKLYTHGAGGIENGFYMVHNDLKIYLCKAVRPRRHAHAFLPLYLGWARNRYDDPDVVDFPRYKHNAWLGMGTGIGVQVDWLKRFNLEFMFGLGYGAEMWVLNDVRRTVLMREGMMSSGRLRPRLKIQWVIPLWAK